MRLTLRLPLFLSLSLAASAALPACAQDGAQEPRFADSQVTPVAPAASEPARVPQRPSNADIRAELEAAQRKDGSSLVAHGEPSAAEPGANATSDTNADGGAGGAAEADPERRDFEAKTKERLARIDARAKDLRDRGGKLTATKKTSFDTGFRRFTADRSDAELKLGALAKSGAGWKTGKSNVERSLDDLEASLAKLDDQL